MNNRLIVRLCTYLMIFFISSPIDISAQEITSSSCHIQALATRIDYHDNGTKNNTSDDYFTFDLKIMNPGNTAGWEAIINGEKHASAYGLHRFGPYPVSEGRVWFDIIDQHNKNCIKPNFIVDVPMPFYKIAQPHVSTNLDIQLYPNPAMNEVFMDFSDLIDQNFELRISNQTGTELFNQSFVNNQQTRWRYDMRDLPSGMYFVWVKEEGKRARIFKLVKQRL